MAGGDFANGNLRSGSLTDLRNREAKCAFDEVGNVIVIHIGVGGIFADFEVDASEVGVGAIVAGTVGKVVGTGKTGIGGIADLRTLNSDRSR